MGGTDSIHYECALKDRFAEMEKKIVEIDKRTSVSDEVLKRLDSNNDRLESSNQRLTDLVETAITTFQSIKETMIEMQMEIKNSIKCTEDIKVDQQAMKVEIIDINKKFQDSEEKSKIDLRDIAKDKNFKLLSGAFAVTVIGFILTSCGLLVAVVGQLPNISNILNALTK